MDKQDILDITSEFGKGFRDNSKRLKWARLFFIIGLPLQFIELIFLLLSYRAMLDERYLYLQQYDQYLVIFSALLILVFIGTAWTFIQWLHRSYNNLHLLGLKGLSRTPSTAAWSWWIPIANLYIPYQIINEIWLEGRDHLKKMQMPSLNNFGFSWIGPWWIFYVVSSLFSSFANIGSRFIYTIHDVETTIVVSMISSLAAILSLTFGLRMFACFSKLESALFSVSRPATPSF